MSNAKKTTNKSGARNQKIRTPNPTLHGLLVSRSFSGTVVRVLLFAILTFVVVFVGVTAATDQTGGGAFAAWFAIFAAYLLFDVAYVLMAMIRPLHPRIDRVVLPLALVFSLAAIYAPIIFVGEEGVNVVAFWLASGVVLACALVTRFAILLNALR